ncbi:hypothetical protein K435DRAFT_760059, partial [Dendrothele bispora CBS 962.96]
SLARRLCCPLFDSFRAFSLNRLQNRLLSSSTSSYSSLPLPTNEKEAWSIATDAVQEQNALISKKIRAGVVFHQTPDQRWAEKSKNAQEALERSHINPYSGRSVPVTDGNVASALKKLDTILNRNKVRKQLRLTERHEKKGVKRRRLESERWRRLFAHEVRKNVQLVTKIRNRGA